MNIAMGNLGHAAVRMSSAKFALLGLIAALAGIAGASCPAQAQTKSQSVSVADLDLSTTEGRKAAEERLHQMARRLCNRVADLESLSHQPDYMRCVETSTGAAVAQLQHAIALADARKARRPSNQ